MDERLEMASVEVQASAADAGAAAGAGAGAAAAPSLAQPLLLHYLLAVATLGAYLPIRAYHVARRLDPQARLNRAHAVVWACAVVFIPAACAYLYEVTRLARAAAPAAPRRSSPLRAPALFLALGVVLLATRLADVWAALLLLLPIPFVMVQAELNRLEVRPDPRPRAAPTRWAWLVLAVAMPLSALAIYKLDHRALRTLLTTRSVARGATVRGTRAPCTLHIPAAGWERVAPGGVGDGAEDIGLRKRHGGAWVVVYTQPASATSLDQVVAYRRDLVKDSDGGHLQTLDERRYFLDGADMAPASYAKYTMRYPADTGAYLVLTVFLDDVAVEVVGYAPGASKDLDELAALIRSVQPAAAAAKAGRS